MQELRDLITEKLLEIPNESQLRIIHAITRTIIQENRLSFGVAINQYPEKSFGDEESQCKKRCLPTFNSSSDTVIMIPDNSYMDEEKTQLDSNYQSNASDQSMSRSIQQEPYDYCYLARPVSCYDAPELVKAKYLYMINKCKK